MFDSAGPVDYNKTLIQEEIMAKILKTAFLFSFVLCFFSVFAFAEEITITTYYPSPYGSYNALQVDKLGVGDNDDSGTFTSADVPSTSGEVWIKGDVGIGTDNPGAKLDVAGSIYTSNIGGTNAIELGQGQSSNQYAYIDFHGDSTNSDYALRIIRYNTGANAVSRIEHLGTGAFEFLAAGAAPMIFSTSSTERMRILSGGYVGIGTDTPTVPLYVNTSASIALAASYGAIGASTWASRSAASRAVSIYAPNGTVAGNAIFSVSDQRLKENIAPINPDMVDAFFSTVTPVSFQWVKEKTSDSGFIAQELIKKGFEYLVSEIPDAEMTEQTNAEGIVSPAGRRFVVNYNSIIPILTAGIQKNNLKIASLDNQLASLSSLFSANGAKIQVLENKIEVQQKEIDSLKAEVEKLKK